MLRNSDFSDSLEGASAQVIDNNLQYSEIDAVTATAAARRAFGELPAGARRSRRARFCEPAVPFMSIAMI